MQKDDPNKSGFRFHVRPRILGGFVLFLLWFIRTEHSRHEEKSPTPSLSSGNFLEVLSLKQTLFREFRYRDWSLSRSARLFSSTTTTSNYSSCSSLDCSRVCFMARQQHPTAHTTRETYTGRPWRDLAALLEVCTVAKL